MKRLLPLLLLLLTGSFTRANHIESAYISYRQLTGNTYEIALRTTEGCYGKSTSFYSYQISYGTTLLNDSLRFATERMSSPLGPSCSTTCQTAGGLYLSRERVFKDTIDLSGINDCQIRLSCSISSRDGGFSGPFENMYVYTEFNQCLGVSNSGPVLKPLRQMLSQGLEEYIFYEPIDSFDNRDSMSLSLLQPALKAANSSITYTGNFSPQRPISYSGFPNTPLLYSNAGGWIRITPSQVNQYGYMAGDVYEWLDSAGVKILASKTHFDHKVIVISANSPTAAPALSFLGGGAGVNGAYNPCTDTVQHLNYIVSDSSDTLSYFVKADAPISYSVIDTNAGFKHIRISVLIPDSLILDTFYVRIYARDNNCTLAKERNFLLPFVRFPKPTQFTHPQLDSSFLCNGYRLSLSDPAQQDLSFRFLNTRDTQSLYFQQTGYQHVPIRVSNAWACFVDIQDSVYLNNFSLLQSNTSHPVLVDCPGTELVFNASPSGGTAPYQVKWDNSDTGLQYIAHVPDAVFPDTFSLGMRITDALGCAKQDTFLLISKPKLFGDITGNGGVRCHGNGPLNFGAAGALGTAPYTYNWFTLGTQQFIQVDPSKDTLIFLEVTDSNGCTSMDSMQIIRYVGPAANAGSDQEVCSGTAIALQAASNPGMSATYIWQGIGSGAGLSYKPVTSGYVLLEVRDSLGCRHFDSLYVRVFPKPDLLFQGPTTACEHEAISFISIVSGGTAPFQFAWTGGPQNANSANYSFNAVQSAQITCILLDSNGCRDTAEQALNVFSFDTIVFQPGPLVYCENNPSFSLVNWVNPKGGSWSGKGVRSNQFFPDSANPGLHAVYYTIGTGQCFDKDSLILEVRTKPLVDFEVDSQYGPLQSTVNFTNKTPGNFQWHWDFGDPNQAGDTSNLKNPSYTYAQAGTYSPRLIAEDGICRDSLKKTGYIQRWPTGIPAQEQTNILLYPNPFSSYLTLENPEGTRLNWKLFSMQGQLLNEGFVDGVIGRIPTETLLPGMYLFQINGENRVLVKEK